MAMFTPGFCFDDVLLIPKHSNIGSRDDVDLSVSLPKGIELKIPLLSSNMKTVTDVDMSIAISDLGGLPILHRFDEYLNLVYKFDQAQSASTGIVGASVGIKSIDKDLVFDLYNTGCRVICVDVAHGDHGRVSEFVANIRSKYSDILIIAGNVVTESGALGLWNAGADVIKCGVGNGATCSTRIETGNGYPQLSALNNVVNGCYPSRDGLWPMFIADGGIKSAGDCVKSLVFADLVMIGNLFAGTDEAPGEIIQSNGHKYKRYEGSSTYKSKHIEGVSALVPYKGKVKDIVTKLTDGIRSGCSYQGARNLKELKENPEFVIISNAGLTESHPHSVIL
jgi:IMP dehydrogenase